MKIVNNKRENIAGFSLVELAVVLVIIGLLIGGTMAGSEMVQIAKLRGVISTVAKYKLAIDSFEQVYEGLPGDLSNAAHIVSPPAAADIPGYWPLASDCSDPYAAEDGSTCNGNGDGKIGSGSATDDTEPYTAWDQLSLAKMIPGIYSGAGSSAVVGDNCPASSDIDGGGYSLSYFAAPWAYVDALGRDFPGNYIVFGKTHATDNYLNTAVLTPDRAFYIDSKTDDGTPDFGKVLAGAGGGASGACVSGSAYDFSNLGVACTIFFNIGNE